MSIVNLSGLQPPSCRSRAPLLLLNCPSCRSRTICPTIVNLFKQLYFACTSAYIHSLQFLVMARAERRHTNDRACLRSACLHIFDRSCLRATIYLFRPHITCFKLAVFVCAERNYLSVILCTQFVGQNDNPDLRHLRIYSVLFSGEVLLSSYFTTCRQALPTRCKI